MTSSLHDALFKKTFSQIEHATRELQVIRPPGLAARIDFATLALCPGTYVDGDFRQLKAQRAMLAKLLLQRFGALPDEAAARVDAAGQVGEG